MAESYIIGAGGRGCSCVALPGFFIPDEFGAAIDLYSAAMATRLLHHLDSQRFWSKKVRIAIYAIAMFLSFS